MFIMNRCTLHSCMYAPTSFSKGRITSLLNSFKKLPSSHAARKLYDYNLWCQMYCPQKNHVTAAHSHPQRSRPFWSAPRIATSGKVQFSVHVHSNCFVFSSNQIHQIWLWTYADWWEVCESWTSGVIQKYLPRDHDSWCWPKWVWSLRTRMTAAMINTRILFTTLVSTCSFDFLIGVDSTSWLEPWPGTLCTVLG